MSDETKTQAGRRNIGVDHAGHKIVVRSPDMAGRPVVICVTCNVRLADRG